MSSFYSSIQRKVDAMFGRRPSSYPYMSGDSFRAVAQHVYGDPRTDMDPSKVKLGEVVFIKTDRVADFMRDVHPRIANRYVVITHNSDAAIDASHIPFLDDAKIIRWFGQNASIEHPKLVPIPIGLENQHWHMNGEKSLFDEIRNDNEKNNILKKFRLLYAFTLATNESERKPAHDILSQNPMADGMEHARGTEGRPLPEEYLRILNGYAMVASPPGNGLDCHRTWESVYLGVLPIVKRSPAMEYFRSLGMPLWVVDSWDQIPRDVRSLRSRYDVVWTNASSKALWMDYWIREIGEARLEA